MSDNLGVFFAIVLIFLVFPLGMFFTHVSLVALEFLYECAGFSVYTLIMFSLIVVTLYGIYGFLIICLRKYLGLKYSIFLGAAPILLYLASIFIRI